MRPRLLDLCCGAGGASKGYDDVGFQVTGVDVLDQPRYPFDFVQADAIEFLDAGGADGFAVVAASPPCPGYSSKARHLAKDGHPLLIAPIRERLQALGVPYIIENVPGAPLLQPVQLCGSAFPPRAIRRHRLFETNFKCPGTACYHDRQRGNRFRIRTGGSNQAQRGLSTVQSIAGHQHFAEAAGEAMGIDWMNRNELADAIPPAYTAYIGRYALLALEKWPR